jgi:hypothetical protein
MVSDIFQFTVIVERPKPDPYSRENTQKPFFFSSFETPEQVVSFVSNLNKGLKIYAIHKMDLEGHTYEMTIGFDNGRLGLIQKR